MALADGALVTDALGALAPGLALADGATATEGAPALEKLPGVYLTLWDRALARSTHQVVRLAEGDRLPLLFFKISGGDWEAYDLDGATIVLRMWLRGASTYTIEAACTYWKAAGAQTGVVRYVLADGDTDTPGEYLAQVVATLGGLNLFSEIFAVRVRARL